MSVLRADGLRKTFGRRRVVDGVELSVEPGEIVGLLGPNGAGKTTIFRMVCGMIEPDAGRVFLNDRDVTRWPMYRRAKEGGMGYLAQEASVFRKMTVEQNILCMLELLGVSGKARRARCTRLLQQFGIDHLRKSKAKGLSGGERRRLEIARCLISDPEIIMLDEPFAAIDPVTVQGIQQTIRELQEEGISILITDHAAREILQIVDRCYVIAKGEVLAEGPPEAIQESEAVRKEYLGTMQIGAESEPLEPNGARPEVDEVEEEPARRRGWRRGKKVSPRRAG